MPDSAEQTLGIEIGPRDNPLIKSIRKDLLPLNSQIVLFDKRLDGLEQILEFNSSGLQEIKTGEATQADASKLPLPSESADLILASNLFGADGYMLYTLERGFQYDEKESIGSFSDIALEWNRVLKKGGKIVILETTPTSRNKKDIVDLFENLGLITLESYDKNNLNKIITNETLFGRNTLQMADIKSWGLVMGKPS